MRFSPMLLCNISEKRNRWRPAGSRSQSKTQSQSVMSYRFALSRGSRKGGQSASAKHAYHERLEDYAVGREGVRDDLTATGCGNLPAFALGDPAAFWMATDSYERANASLFIDLQMGLPWELTPEQQRQALRAYCDRMFNPLRLPYSWAIHDDDHVHLMLSERMTDDAARSAEGHFKRYNSKEPERGGVQKTRELQSTEWLIEARSAWAEEVNKVLVAAGHEPYYDHRSLKEQRDDALERGLWRKAAELNRLVEEHEGPRIAGMRRRLERGEVMLDELPQYAQVVIVGNDTIRSETAAYMRRIAGMTDDELRLMQADDIQRIAREHLTGRERTELAALEQQQKAEHAEQLAALAQAQADAELGELVAAVQVEHLDDLLAVEVVQAHSAALIEDAERAVELDELIDDEQRHQGDDLLVIEREQAHAAALIEDAERQRRAKILHALEQWQGYLGDRPEVGQVRAAAAQVRAGLPGAIEQAEQLAGSLRAAEQQRAEQAKRERQEAQRRAELEALRQQRVAAMEAEREQQRQAERELLTSFARQPDTPKTRAPEPRGGSDEWVEFVRDGERYRHPDGRPGELYWQNPAGEWHLQPDEPDQPDYDGYDYR